MSNFPEDLRPFLNKGGAGVVIYPQSKYRKDSPTKDRLLELAEEGWVTHSARLYVADNEHDLEYDPDDDTYWSNGVMIKPEHVVHVFVTTDKFEQAPERKNQNLLRKCTRVLDAAQDLRSAAQQADNEELAVRALLCELIMDVKHPIKDWASVEAFRRTLEQVVG